MSKYIFRNSTAEDGNGNKFFLEVYHDWGGSLLATPLEKLTPEYENVAEALIKYIESAELI